MHVLINTIFLNVLKLFKFLNFNKYHGQNCMQRYTDQI